MNSLEEAAMMFGLIVGVVTIVFIIAKYNYLIKKAMIEKGLSVSASGQKMKYLDVGCIFIGLGVGLLISSLYTLLQLTEDTIDLLAWGTICICGGLGVLLAHRIRRRFEA